MAEAYTGAGSAVLSVRLARALAAATDGVTYLESNECGCMRCRRRNMAFFAAELDRNVLSRGFRDVFYERYLDGPSGGLNLCRGVNWIYRREDSPPFDLRPADVDGRLIIRDDPEDLSGSDLILCLASARREALGTEHIYLDELYASFPSKLRLVMGGVASEAQLRRSELMLGQRADFVLWEEALSPGNTERNKKTVKELAEYIISLY